MTFYRWRSSILPWSHLPEGTCCQGGGLRIIPSWWMWFKDHSRPFHNPDKSLWKGVWFFAVMAQSVPFWIKGSSHLSGRRPQGSKIFPFFVPTLQIQSNLQYIYNFKGWNGHEAGAGKAHWTRGRHTTTWFKMKKNYNLEIFLKIFPRLSCLVVTLSSRGRGKQPTLSLFFRRSGENKWATV